MSNLLFICSRNQWRSPTAEILFRNNTLHCARSAGTSDKARIWVNQKMLDWAGIIFFMERKHLDIVRRRFSIANQLLVVLDIEDDYHFGDEELIAILKQGLVEYF